MLKVIIADDQDLIRESLKIVLDINEDIQVVGMAYIIQTPSIDCIMIAKKQIL